MDPNEAYTLEIWEALKALLNDYHGQVHIGEDGTLTCSLNFKVRDITSPTCYTAEQLHAWVMGLTMFDQEDRAKDAMRIEGKNQEELFIGEARHDRINRIVFRAVQRGDFPSKPVPGAY